MVDIQKIISEKKGVGYEHWAKKFNLKQTAKVLCFLKENNIDSLSNLKKHIFNYSKTRDTYEKYRKSGYSKNSLPGYMYRDLWTYTIVNTAGDFFLCIN